MVWTPGLSRESEIMVGDAAGGVKRDEVSYALRLPLRDRPH
jgi:hypothetical protein